MIVHSNAFVYSTCLPLGCLGTVIYIYSYLCPRPLARDFILFYKNPPALRAGGIKKKNFSFPEPLELIKVFVFFFL